MKIKSVYCETPCSSCEGKGRARYPKDLEYRKGAEYEEIVCLECIGKCTVMTAVPWDRFLKAVSESGD